MQWVNVTWYFMYRGTESKSYVGTEILSYVDKKKHDKFMTR